MTVGRITHSVHQSDTKKVALFFLLKTKTIMKQIKVQFLCNEGLKEETVSAPSHREARNIIESKYDNVMVYNTYEKV